MAIILTQTDTAADNCTANGGTSKYCDPNGWWEGGHNQKATAGGTAGTTPQTVTMGASASTARAILFQSAANEPNSISWESGNWVVRVEITTANMNVNWGSTYICRVDSVCTDASHSIGSLTGQTTSFGTTGVKTHTVSGSADSGAAATDEICILVDPTNTTSMSQTFGWKPSQNIDTPLTQGSGAASISNDIFGFFQAVKRAAYFFILEPLKKIYAGNYFTKPEHKFKHDAQSLASDC